MFSPLDTRDDLSLEASRVQRSGLARSRIAPMPALVIPADLEPQRGALLLLDAEARRLVEATISELQDGEPDVDVVGMLWSRVGRYARNGLTWLSDTNRDLANALQRDPRLAVVSQMYVAAESAVIAARRNGTDTHDRRMLVETYAKLLRAQAPK